MEQVERALANGEDIYDAVVYKRLKEEVVSGYGGSTYGEVFAISAMLWVRRRLICIIG